MHTKKSHKNTNSHTPGRSISKINSLYVEVVRRKWTSIVWTLNNLLPKCGYIDSLHCDSFSLTYKRSIIDGVSNIVLSFCFRSFSLHSLHHFHSTFIIHFRNLIFRPASMSNKFGQITPNIFCIFFFFFVDFFFCLRMLCTAQVLLLKRTKTKIGPKRWALGEYITKRKLLMWWTFCRTIEVVNCISWLWSIGCPK